MENKKTILMMANSDTAANGFLSFVERLEDREDIRFVMVCHLRVTIQAVEEKGRRLGNADLHIIDFDKEERIESQKQTAYDYRYVKDKIYISLVKAVFNTAKIVRQNRKGLRKARDIMKREKPNVVLLYDDNRLEMEKFFIHYAKKQGIKTVVAPICFASMQGIFINPSNGFRIRKGAALPITAKIIKRLNPRIDKEYEDQIVFFGQPFLKIIDHLMGFRVPDPWVQGSLADIVCTAYQEQYDEIVGELGRENVEGRLFLTESVEDGIIIEGYKNRSFVRSTLSDKYGLNEKTIVVVAFSERLQLWPKENDLYNKGVIVQSVLEYFDEVLVSLHPKSNPAENQFLENYSGCHIVEEPLRKMIGAADLVVYADISSVSHWVDWLHIDKVTYRSYSMQDKWTDDMVLEFKRKLENAKKAVTGEKTYRPERGIDFAEFVLDLI